MRPGSQESFFFLDARILSVPSAFGSVIGIVLNPTLGFNDLVAVHSFSEFCYSVAWMGSFSAIAGTIAGQITGAFADR